MNSLIASNNSLFLPLNQLIPQCNKLYSSINNESVSQKERIAQEQTLWNEIKKIRALKDPSVFSYLIGYYHTILFQIANTTAKDDLFQYHVLIRLGDLNRYMARIDVAEYYYCNARNLFPQFGHAYNQLGLLTKPTNFYKCCYYYARAAKSSDRPTSAMAMSNLNTAVSNSNCEILNCIINGSTCPSLDEGTTNAIELPEIAMDWFYVIVVAIYAENIQPIARPFLNYLNENFAIQSATTAVNDTKTTIIYCDQDSYVLLASLDILLDWLALNPQGKAQCSTLAIEFRRIRKCLQCTLASYNSSLPIKDVSTTTPTTSAEVSSDRSMSFGNSTLKDSLSTINSSVSQKDSPSVRGDQSIALPHDYILKGFSPLEKIHEKLIFKRSEHSPLGRLDDRGKNGERESEHNQRFIESFQLIQFLQRIQAKMDAFGPIIKKRTRNIALESILSNMNPSSS